MNKHTTQCGGIMAAEGDYIGVSQRYGYLSGGLHNKDYSVLGSKLGFPYIGKVPYPVARMPAFNVVPSYMFVFLDRLR